MADTEDNLIERITENRQPHYEPWEEETGAEHCQHASAPDRLV
jgi:hypothetical protein